jgi:hypothetical protein
MEDSASRRQAEWALENVVKRWRGIPVSSDVVGDTDAQALENIAAALNIDFSKRDDPLVATIILAIRDRSPERAMRTCREMLVTVGQMGPLATRAQQLIQIPSGGRKIMHCLKHGYYMEGKSLDELLSAFQSKHCNVCPDRSPRDADWQWGEQTLAENHYVYEEYLDNFTRRTGLGARFSSED